MISLSCTVLCWPESSGKIEVLVHCLNTIWPRTLEACLDWALLKLWKSSGLTGAWAAVLTGKGTYRLEIPLRDHAGPASCWQREEFGCHSIRAGQSSHIYVCLSIQIRVAMKMICMKSKQIEYWSTEFIQNSPKLTKNKTLEFLSCRSTYHLLLKSLAIANLYSVIITQKYCTILLQFCTFYLQWKALPRQ